MISISFREGKEKIEEGKAKIYSLIPHFGGQSDEEVGGSKPGISVLLDNKSQYFKIAVEIVCVSFNLDVVLDFLNIAFPLFAYKRLSDIINFKRQ
jgi:hypothetical protein